jgi:anti-sigma28 factor (negative regulator of flagellin synthesis)
MRKIWNSWTYYGPGSDSGRSDKRCIVTCRSRRQRIDETTTGGLESALERSMADALEHALDRSDVRAERVQLLKLAIEAGTYYVTSRELAEKLVNNMLGEYH